MFQHFPRMVVINMGLDAAKEREFLAEPSPASKIRFCVRRLESKPRGFLGLPEDSDIFQPKNDTMASEARKIGNQHFVQGDFVSALDWYNRSMCHAPKNSENFAMAFANRSAVYFRAGFLRICLENIERALENNCPADIRGKLEARREICEEKMKKMQGDKEMKYETEYQAWDLSYGKSEKCPMMSGGVEIMKDERGIGIRATRDVKPGDILMIEKAFASHVESHFEYRRCVNCLEQNYLNLIPCDRCTKAMFCSYKCQMEAEKRFHKFECKIKDGMMKFFDNHVWPIGIALRATLKAFSLYDDPNDLQKLVNELENDNGREKTPPCPNIDYLNFTDEQHFRAAYFLPSIMTVKPGDLFKYSNECAAVWHFLSHHTDFPQFLSQSPSLEDLFLTLLYRFYRISITNGMKFGNKSDETDLYASGIFTLSKIMRHSCIPNVFRVNNANSLRIVAQCFIKAGEQVVINASVHALHLASELPARRHLLLTQYNIDCDCPACRLDYPTMAGMIPRDLMLCATINSDSDKFEETFDKKLGMKLLEKYKKHIQKYQNNPRTFEFHFGQGNVVLLVCGLMHGPPMKMKLKPVN